MHKMLSEATRSSSNGPGISFARLESSLKAINMFYQGIADLRGRRLLSSAKSLARVSTTYLAALFANKSECIHSSQASSVFTSLTLDIDMLPKALAETTSDGHAQATARSLVKFYRCAQLACKIARHLGLVLQLAPPYRVIASLARRSLDERTFEFTRGLFPLIGSSRVSFTGSYVSARMIRWFASRLTRHNLARLESNIGFAATLAICAPLARFASRIEEHQNPTPFPGSLHEHDNRDRPALTSGVLHRHRTRPVCAASAVF